MNRYLSGAYIQASDKPLQTLSQVRPMPVALARQIVSACIAELGQRPDEYSKEAKRQLVNMAHTLNAKAIKMLPDVAADVLGSAVEAADICGLDEGLSDDASQEDVISDFGWTPEARLEVDSSGDFDFGDGDGDYDAIVGAYAIGMFDIGAAQLKMNGLRPVTVGAAKALIRGAVQVMAVANTTAAQNGLPGQTARDNCFGHLQWHAAKLKDLRNDAAVYDSGDDAKKWAMQAFIEANATEEGAAYLDEAWSAMWVEIGKNLAALPTKVAKYAGNLLSTVVENATGIPTWAIIVGAVTAIGLVGYGAYKILAGPAGGAIVGGYLGGRR